MVAPRPAAKELTGISTPLIVEEWRDQLESHPDREYVHYLIEGIDQGLRIGYDYSQHQCKTSRHNMLSVKDNAKVVEDYLLKEYDLGWVLGPFQKDSLQVHVNRFGVIPKPHQPGKWWTCQTRVSGVSVMANTLFSLL